MKPGGLTARQAARCENARGPVRRCKCRCGGALHGKGRGRVRELAKADPHYPDDEGPKERRARLEREQFEKRQLTLKGFA